MPANTAPIYTLTANTNGVAISAANTKSNGDGTIATDIFKVFTAGSNGSWISKVRFNPVATTAATTTTATVGRVYLSTKSSGATSGGTDTWLLQEVALPSVSADATTTPVNPVEVPLNMAIPSGQTILVSTHHAPAANSSQQAIAVGGDY